MTTFELEHEPLEQLLDRVADADAALISLGIPRCPACLLMPPSLRELARARPGLVVGMTVFDGPEDWAKRTDLLWPRDIHVSRSSVPVLALLRRGRTVATRPGGAPAYILDDWLTEHLGPPEHPIPRAPSSAETSTLDRITARRTQQQAVKSLRDAGRGALDT